MGINIHEAFIGVRRLLDATHSFILADRYTLIENISSIIDHSTLSFDSDRYPDILVLLVDRVHYI